MKHIKEYALFESMEPMEPKELKEITVKKIGNPQIVMTIIVEPRTNRITDIRNPRAIRHYLIVGNILNKRQLENWMNSNGFEIDGEKNFKKQLNGNELVKFMMKRGFR